MNTEIASASKTGLETQAKSASRRFWTCAGQGMIEFALILPIVLLFVLGMIETGHLLAVYSGVSGAAKQSARYGSVGGDNAQGTTFYLDCQGMRQTAKRTALMHNLSNNDINIAYDRGTITSTLGLCGSDNIPRFSDTGTQMTEANSSSLINSGRVVVSITTTYQPLVPLIPIPPLPMTFVAARTIFTSIEGAPATPRPPTDLSIAILDQPDPVAPTATLTYTLQINNAGPGTATSITVVDQLPSGLTFQSASGSGWSCGFASGTVTCLMASLAQGATSNITILVTAPSTGRTLTNTATVSSTRADPNTGNNTAAIQTTVLTASDLVVSQVDTPDPALPSSVITYTISVSNQGLETASFITVTDQLPAGTSLLSFSGSGWTCAAGGGAVTCTRPSLPVGAAPNIVLTLTAPGSIGVITNTVSITAATNDVNPSNNTSEAQTTIATDVDLAITQTDSPDPAGMNDSLTYVIRVTNNGPSPANSVTMLDTFPTGTTFISASGVNWTCNRSGNVVTCSLPSLAIGAAPDITLVVRAPNSGASLTNTVQVSSATSESNLSNNTATETTTVLACNPNVVSAADSRVLASLPQVQADGSQASEVLVTLRDNCGNLLAGHPVSLASSRGVVDTITPGNGATNANGQFTFPVTSAFVSPYASGTFQPSTFTATSGSTTIQQTANIAFVCVVGSTAPFSIPQDVKYLFTNNTGLNRRLVSITLTWPNGGARALNIVNFGPDQIWNGNGSSSPYTINSWNAGDQTLSAGASKFLQLIFNYNLPGTGQYTLVTQWDNTAGGSVCTAPAVTVTR
jgi:uncharacterized repeat protein (TIGR01451 family)